MDDHAREPATQDMDDNERKPAVDSGEGSMEVDDAEEGDKTESNNTPGSIPETTGKGFDEEKDLKKWSKDEVKAWLEHFQEEGGEDFKIDRVACLGKRFAARTKADLKEFADGLVGIDIFNAKEALLRKQKGNSQGNPSKEFNINLFAAEIKNRTHCDTASLHVHRPSPAMSVPAVSSVSAPGVLVNVNGGISNMNFSTSVAPAANHVAVEPKDAMLAVIPPTVDGKEAALPPKDDPIPITVETKEEEESVESLNIVFREVERMNAHFQYIPGHVLKTPPPAGWISLTKLQLVEQLKLRGFKRSPTTMKTISKLSKPDALEELKKVAHLEQVADAGAVGVGAGSSSEQAATKTKRWNANLYARLAHVITDPDIRDEFLDSELRLTRENLDNKSTRITRFWIDSGAVRLFNSKDFHPANLAPNSIASNLNPSPPSEDWDAAELDTKYKEAAKCFKICYANYIQSGNHDTENFDMFCTKPHVYYWWMSIKMFDDILTFVNCEIPEDSQVEDGLDVEKVKPKHRTERNSSRPKKRKQASDVYHMEKVALTRLEKRSRIVKHILFLNQEMQKATQSDILKILGSELQSMKDELVSISSSTVTN